MAGELVKILKENGLPGGPKAQYIIDHFDEYFAIAEEWTERAKSINVTDEKQTMQMELARTGRLFIRDKRIAIEKARKMMKEDVLAEGRAIDGIAKKLTALLSPIEDHLDRQEHFVELKQKAEREARQREIERRMMEEERLAQQAEAVERHRLQVENERLRNEAEERERAIRAEREKAEAERLAAERVLAEEKARAEAEKQRIEEQARKEREAAELKAKHEREKAEAEKRELEARLAAMVTCPECGHKFIP